MGPRKYLIFVALAVGALSCVLVWKIQSMEKKIATLEASLKEKEDALKKARLHARVVEETPLVEPGNPADGNGERIVREQAAAGKPAGSYQVLKELESDSATDPRSSAEKLQALLADNPTDEEAAIAARFIFNKASDSRALPDYSLQAIYASQSNPDLRRVIAQVLSQRGNDALLNDQIAEAQATLKSAKPKDRLDALNQLGKIHSVHAVDAIAPSLQDSDSTVRLAALFALRDSGNQRHVNLVEPLTRDPDPSVSTLAENVVSALRNLSSSARTSYSRADIEAELPPIANP
jgi:HEAT repeat protein